MNKKYVIYYFDKSGNDFILTEFGKILIFDRIEDAQFHTDKMHNFRSYKYGFEIREYTR